MTARVVPGSSHLLVSELFGPTFQGEGPRSGQQAVFVRLSRCNLRCPACDTPYTWDWSRFDSRAESHRMPTSAVLEWVLARTPTLVVVTGGEPLLQQRHLIPLVEQLTDVGRVVEVETNGTITPDPALVAAVTAFNVSPKVASFAHPDDTVVRPAVLESLMASGKAVFKFVVTGPADLDDVGVLVEAHRLRPVWVMPAATTSGEALNGLRSVAEETLRRGWNLTGRLHLLLWEDVRGR